MFGRATITLGIGPHSSCKYFEIFVKYDVQLVGKFHHLDKKF